MKINNLKLRKAILETLNEYVSIDVDTLNELGMMLEVEVLKWVAEEKLKPSNA